MGKKGKLIERLRLKPRDFTFDEMNSLLLSLGFEKCNLGKTSGSRIKYMHGTVIIRIHKPHPRNELKSYQILHVLEQLVKGGLI